MNVPDDLRYSTDHEWVRVEDGRVRVGITDYAQDALGDVVFVELPEVGTHGRGRRQVQRGRVDQVGVATSTPRSSGTVVEVNAELADAPQRLNEDPYGEGWICVIEPDDPAELDALLDAAAYRGARRGLGSPSGGLTSAATTAGTGTRSGPTSARRAARRSRPSADEHTTITFHPTAPTDPIDDEVTVDLDEIPAGVGRARRHAGPERRARGSPSTRPVTTAGRHPDSDIFLDDITVSRRHAEVARGGDGYRGARRRVAQRHLPEPGAGRGGRARRTATSCRSASSSSCSSSVGTHVRDRHGRPRAPVDRRGPQPAAGRVPRRHDLEDPLPREPGPARPRAHAVGLPEVLRGRHRAAALDPAPAARELPARSR